ncbi:MAG: lipopolysaccharide kinase InaA family protein [Pseudomonadota bacterium]
MKAKNFFIHGEYANHYQDEVMMLANRTLPAGWQWVTSSKNSVVAEKTGDEKVFYKEFLQRNNFEGIKAFLNGSRSKRARKQSDILVSAGLPTPRILCWGKSNRSVFIITQGFDGIGFYLYLLNYFSPPLSPEKVKEKRLLLKAAGSLIGKLHQAGIVHGDLRQNNLLVKKENNNFRFSLIDNERNRKWRYIPHSQIVKNLIQFSIASHDLLSRTDLRRLFIAYKSNYPDFSVKEEKKLLQTVYDRKTLRILRSNIKFYIAPNCKSFKHKMFYGKYLKDSLVAKHFMQDADPDKWFNTGSITLKHDKNITINLLSEPDGDVVAKRFVSNGFLFHVKTWMKKERALNLWNMTHFFKELGIPVALPLGYVAEKKGLLHRTTYFYSQYITEAKSLMDLSQNMKDFSNWIENNNTIPRFALVLSKLHSNGFCHGDTKWVNILVNENSGNFWLIDLDGASFSKSKLARSMLKDLGRFIVDMIETGLSDKFIDNFLMVYCNARVLNKELVQKKVNPHISKILKRHKKIG